jgi:hypothetical protein
VAERTFNINTEPHTARIGEHVLLFEPEVIGSDFIQAYTALQDVQQRASASNRPARKASATQHAKASEVPDTKILKELDSAMRAFLEELLVPESRETFRTMRLPQRVLVQLIEWVTELYGGGSGNPDAAGGTSSG